MLKTPQKGRSRVVSLENWHEGPVKEHDSDASVGHSKHGYALEFTGTTNTVVCLTREESGLGKGGAKKQGSKSRNYRQAKNALILWRAKSWLCGP